MQIEERHRSRVNISYMFIEISTTALILETDLTGSSRNIFFEFRVSIY